MSIRWAESGGQYHTNTANPAGLFGAGANNATSTAPASRNGSTWANNLGTTGFQPTPNIGGVNGFNGLIAGVAFLTGASFSNNGILMQFLDNNAAEQCSLRTNGSGQLFFSRNGTNLGAGNPTLSTNVLPINSWVYIEFKAAFATGATGTCEVKVNGTVWLTVTSIQNATTNAKGWASGVRGGSVGGTWIMDSYLLDTDNTVITGDNTYLGDVTVAELYPNGAGVNSAWTANPAASFSLTSVNTTGVYQGTITGGASNAYVGYYFIITGFTNGANNVTGVCSASSATSITIVTQGNGTITTVTETHAGTATFQNLAQDGIHGGIVDSYSTTNNGTRPNNDVTYYSDSTTNDKSDFAHQALSLTGTIVAVIHRTYARKDDAGTRQIAQICESTGTEEIGSTISLSTTYTYYDDIIETDPHTAAAWTLTGFNAATFGWKELT